MQKFKQKVSLVILFFSLFIFCNGYAQQKIIFGGVTDSGGDPVIGANVAIKGTSIGTVTDVDGNFSLTVPEAGKILVISYLGFTTQELPIDKTSFNIVLQENTSELDEVVVIGYGTTKKKDLTGSISTIKGDVLAKVPVANAAEAITGRLPGVRVTTTDGSPDAEMMIRVRGGGSITGDNTPLYIVDGFPVASFSNIPAGDIEDITVLKDASSTAIYGAQGANGVVLITTKKPQAGNTRVSYNGFMQSKRLSKRMDVMDPYEYVKFQYEWAAIGGSSDITSFQNKFGYYEDMDLYKYQKGTDYQDDMFGNNVVSQQHNISITGGTEKTRYLISGTYNMDGGLMPYSDYGRYYLNFKLDQEISRNLIFRFNARTTDTKVNGEGSSGGTNKVRTFEAVSRGPVRGLQGMAELTQEDFTTEDEWEQYLEDSQSFAERLFQNWRRRNTRSFAYDASLDWLIIKGLTYRVEGGYTYEFDETKRYRGETTTDAINNGGLPMITWEKVNGNRWRVMNMLTYELGVGKNSKFNIMAGQEVSSIGSNRNNITAKGFSTDLSPEKIFANIALGEYGSTSTSSISPPNNLASFFGRVGYYFGERYLATFSLRADGSSLFAPGKQWGYFPSAAVKWRVAEEWFMENAKKWLSDLSLRLSYGEAGNNRISPREYVLDYTLSTSGTYAIGDRQNNYYANSNMLANPDIKWESMITRNIGLDFGFFNQRIWGNIDCYWNTSKDLLLNLTTIAPGYSTMRQNIGQTTNKGIEIALNADIVRQRNFMLGVNFNIGFNKSNVDALDKDNNTLYSQTGWASTDLRGLNEYEIHVGQPLGDIYGWITDGYYTTADFERYDESTGRYILKNGIPVSNIANGRVAGMNPRPGAIKFKDISGPDGTPDGVVDDYDRTIIGNGIPKFQGGFGFNGTFLKNFDYLINFAFVYGNDIYNANKAIMTQQYRTSWPNLLNIMNSEGRYTYLADDGTIVTDLATLAAMNEGANAKPYWSPLSFGNTNAAIHSALIEDGSFLRLQNVTLGYSLPLKISSKFSCQRLRAYCTLNNVYVWTNYSGYDPEVSAPGRSNAPQQMIPGLDYSGYPKSFSWTLGLNVTF